MITINNNFVTEKNKSYHSSTAQVINSNTAIVSGIQDTDISIQAFNREALSPPDCVSHVYISFSFNKNKKSRAATKTNVQWLTYMQLLSQESLGDP